MPLDFDLKNIQNWQKVCYINSDEEVYSPDSRLSPITKALIYVSVVVGMPEINRKNAPEFFARAKLIESIDGPFLTGSYLRPEDVKKHIGLTTNADKKTHAAFLRSLNDTLEFFKRTYRSSVGW